MPRQCAEDKLKLNVRHIFNCDMDTYWAMFWDPRYAEKIEQETGVRREVLWERHEGPVKVYRVRFTPDAELPSAVAKLTGSKKLIYEQENRLNTETHTMEWQVFPAVAKDKVEAKGTMVMRTVGDTVERTVDGDISVRVPIIGRRIEKAIMESVSSSYERAAEITRSWLSENT